MGQDGGTLTRVLCPRVWSPSGGTLGGGNSQPIPGTAPVTVVRGPDTPPSAPPNTRTPGPQYQTQTGGELRAGPDPPP